MEPKTKATLKKINALDMILSLREHDFKIKKYMLTNPKNSAEINIMILAIDDAEIAAKVLNFLRKIEQEEGFITCGIVSEVK